MTSAGRTGPFVVAAAGVLAGAQAVGMLVNTRLAVGETYVVSDLLHLTHLRNTGAVFGLFPGNSLFFAVTSTVTILGLCVYLLRRVVTAPWQAACVGCIAGAAASNVCDRIVYGAVIDYLDVQGIPYWHYVFNVADAAIHVGAWPLVLFGGRGSARGDRPLPGEAEARPTGIGQGG